MILDKQYEFSVAQTVAAIVSTIPSTNIFDLYLLNGWAPGPGGILPALSGARDMGIGDTPALKIFAAMTAAFVSAGGGTLQVHFQGAPDDGTGNPGTYVTYVSSPLYAVANLGAGARLLDIDWPRPPAGVVIPRFVRLLYQIATATSTAGAVNAYVVLDRQDQIVSPAGFQSAYPPGLVVNN
jgi:hypothetical protein